MRTKTLLLTAALSAAGIATSMAQVYSANAVGYVNVTFSTGFTMAANPFVTGDNTIGGLFASVPDGTQIHLFTPGSGFTPYTYDAGLGGWDDPSAVIEFGGGFFLNNINAPFAHTYVGEVAQGSLSTPIPPGYSVKSSKVPQAGLITALLNYTPGDGDQVQQFGATGFTPYTFDAGLGGWDEEPTLAVAEAVFIFNAGALKNWTRTFSVN